MNDREVIEMMQRCRHEVIILRQQIELLRPKAEAYDNLATVLRLLPKPGVIMEEDLVWIIDKRIKELQAKEPSDV
jgi:hypothetical protein